MYARHLIHRRNPEGICGAAIVSGLTAGSFLRKPPWYRSSRIKICHLWSVRRDVANSPRDIQKLDAATINSQICYSERAFCSAVREWRETFWGVTPASDRLTTRATISPPSTDCGSDVLWNYESPIESKSPNLSQVTNEVGTAARYRPLYCVRYRQMRVLGRD